MPVHTTGKPRGVTEQGGILDVLVHNLAVIAPGPRRIPAEVVVDVTGLAIGESIKAGEIPLPQDCKLGVDADVAVVTVLPPQKIVEEPQGVENPEVPATREEE